jgi:TetR/AcrR family transcriptional regulator, transcriptional repressor for nem operon
MTTINEVKAATIGTTFFQRFCNTHPVAYWLGRRGGIVKVSKEQVAANRAALVQAADRLFREHGINGVGVAEICKRAGLTHGALYAQFPSKDALVAEALAYGLDRNLAHLMAAEDGHDDHPPALTAYLDAYLTPQHRDDLAGGCPMAASASEIARQDDAVSTQFSAGFERMVEAIQALLGPSATSAAATTPQTADARQRALAIAAAMIGGIAMARAVHKARPDLSDDIVMAVRQVLGAVGGEAAIPSADAAANTRG